MRRARGAYVPSPQHPSVRYPTHLPPYVPLPPSIQILRASRVSPLRFQVPPAYPVMHVCRSCAPFASRALPTLPDVRSTYHVMCVLFAHPICFAHIPDAARRALYVPRIVCAVRAPDLLRAHSRRCPTCALRTTYCVCRSCTRFASRTFPTLPDMCPTYHVLCVPFMHPICSARTPDAAQCAPTRHHGSCPTLPKSTTLLTVLIR
jgi:hypothetical protein